MTIENVVARLATLRRARLNAETNAAIERPGSVITGKGAGVDRAGNAIITTELGGTLTAEESQFIGVDDVVQVATSAGGTARATQGIIQRVAEQAQTISRRLLFKLVAPVIGSNFGVAGDGWVHEKPAEVVNGFVQADLYYWANNGWVRIGGGGAVSIQEDGVALAQRSNLNFGAGVLATDDPANDRVNITSIGNPIIFSASPPPFPVTGSPNQGDGWYDQTVDRLWLFDATSGEYEPTGTKSWQGAPPTTDPNAFAAGDRVTATLLIAGELQRAEWEWDELTSDWVLLSCCDGPPDDPPDIVCPPGTYIDNDGTQDCTSPP